VIDTVCKGHAILTCPFLFSLQTEEAEEEEVSAGSEDVEDTGEVVCENC
jgi:hypothetical protein